MFHLNQREWEKTLMSHCDINREWITWYINSNGGRRISVVQEKCHLKYIYKFHPKFLVNYLKCETFIRLK